FDAVALCDPRRTLAGDKNLFNARAFGRSLNAIDGFVDAAKILRVVEKRADIEEAKEVADILWTIQVLVHGPDNRNDGRAGKNAAEELDHEGQSVAFVAGHGEYGAKERLVGAGGWLAGAIERPSERDGPVLFLCGDDIAASYVRRGEIDLDGKAFASGERGRDGIGAEESIVAALGRHGRLAVRHREQDKLPLSGVVAITGECAEVLRA